MTNLYPVALNDRVYVKQKYVLILFNNIISCLNAYKKY